jgi:uncharacterized protein YkwD
LFVIAITSLVCAENFTLLKMPLRHPHTKTNKSLIRWFRRRIRRGSSALLLALLGITTLALSVQASYIDLGGTPSPATSGTPIRRPDVVAKVADPSLRNLALDLVNQSRQRYGLVPLVSDPLLDQVAQFHAQDMLQKDYFEHNSPDGKNLRDRYLQFGGQRGVGVGENLFYYRDFKTVVPTPDAVRVFQEGWLDSQGHRENMLFPRWRKFGYGVAVGPDSRQYGVQTFSF